MRQMKKRHNSTQTQRRGGFTLVELMVVLVIASIVSALTLSGFKSLTQSNRRTNCQTNMVQIYQALRLYSADESGGFPLYNAASAGSTGIGLWSLYTYPSTATSNGIAQPDDATVPIERYLRHAKSLHCPADDGDTDETLLTTDSGGKQIYNANYCSYQTLDTGSPILATPQDQSTYQPMRTADKSGCTSSNPACDWKRQLLHYDKPGATPAYYSAPVSSDLQVRPPAADTIVTWCKWHRPPGTGTLDTSRPYDNVLFYDGTVRFLSVTQVQGTATVAGWQRLQTAP